MNPSPETVAQLAEVCRFWAKDRLSYGKEVPASIYLMMADLLSDEAKARDWISHARHFGFEKGGSK